MDIMLTRTDFGELFNLSSVKYFTKTVMVESTVFVHIRMYVSQTDNSNEDFFLGYLQVFSVTLHKITRFLLHSNHESINNAITI